MDKNPIGDFCIEMRAGVFFNKRIVQTIGEGDKGAGAYIGIVIKFNNGRIGANGIMGGMKDEERGVFLGFLQESIHLVNLFKDIGNQANING